MPRSKVIGCGTVGWKAPELITALLPGSETATINPLRAEMFSLGLLVAYILLEKDLFRLPKIASCLAAEYFSTVDIRPSLQSPDAIINCHDGELKNALRKSQQWMISHRLDSLSGALRTAIHELAMPKATVEAMAHFVSSSLRLDPSERPGSFRKACVMMMGNPEEKRTRYGCPT